MSNVRVVGEYDSDKVSDLNSLYCDDESLTHQSFKEESDINTIISQFGIGVNPMVPQEWIENVDIADAVNDFQSAMNQVNEARDQFMSLPASLRSKFDNDAGMFVNFVSDPANLDKMEEYGLLSPEAVNKRVSARQEAADAAFRARMESELKASAKPGTVSS